MSNTNKNPNILKNNSFDCPKCNSKLHFKNIGGILVYDEGDMYDARCPKCNSYYKIKRK